MFGIETSKYMKVFMELELEKLIEIQSIYKSTEELFPEKEYIEQGLELVIFKRMNKKIWISK